MVEGIEVYAVDNLLMAWDVLSNRAAFRPVQPRVADDAELRDIDFDEIKGQPYARRAMEIAAAGGHNLLMCGSPGSGKSMLASRLPTILPPLTHEESLSASKIHSVCGLLPRTGGLLRRRPFRAPHHTISDVGLMGGGTNITPVKFPWRTTACSSWMSSRSSTAAPWRPCASRWRAARSPSPAPAAAWISPAPSCWWRP